MNSNEEYLDSLLKTMEQKEADIEEAAVLSDDKLLYSDDIYNMEEDDIAGLIQDASDNLHNPDEDSINLDFPFIDMNSDSDVSDIEAMLEKAEKNEPVSNEVEEMIELGLKADTEETFSSCVESDSKSFIGKIIDVFKNILKKNKKDVKEKKSLFSKKKEASYQTDIPVADDAIPVADDGIPAEDGMQALLPDENQPDNILNEINQEEFSGFVEDLFADAPAVQMNNSDAADISELLNALENAETEEELNGVDFDLFAGMEQEAEGDLENFDNSDLSVDNKEQNASKKGKKKGFFARLFDFLTEEDEETEENASLTENADGVDELGYTSEENKEAMAQLDKEGAEVKKKGKKGKKGEDEVTDGEDDDVKAAEDRKKKKKPRKEKKQKEPKLYDDSPKLSKKKIRVIAVAAISIAAGILAICLFIPELFDLRSARNAFYDGDYETSYRALYGKKLSESDRIIFEQSEFLLALERRMGSYYNYLAVEDEVRAVEILIQQVSKQKDILLQAQKYGLEDKAEASYQDLLRILYDKYGVSEEEALEISEYRQDALYTLHIKAIAAGEEFVCPDYLNEDSMNYIGKNMQTEDESTEILEDVLPAEEEMTKTEFEEGIN